jgi:polysaccharide export outer membrane protein
MIFVLTAQVAVLLACLTGAVAQDNYQIRPGDTLQVEVLEDNTLNRSALVLPDGNISFPLAGAVQASGLTLGQVQANLQQRLAPNFATPPTVFVSIGRLSEAAAPVAATGGFYAPASIDVFLLGEAAKPGKYEVERGTTLLQFFAQSGGFSKFAATKRIQLRRMDATGVEKVYVFNYKAMEAGTSSGGSTTIADGDVIMVPQRRLFE